MRQTTLRQIKQGEFFKLQPTDSAPVWVKGYYVLSERKFEAYRFEDTNHETFLKGDRKVFIGFTF